MRGVFVIVIAGAVATAAPACGRFGFDAVASGDAGDAGVDAPVMLGSADVAPLFPINGANWNSYVGNGGGGGTAATRPDLACAETDLGYFKCLHGGELRTFTAPGVTSCTGITAADALGAFKWTCSDATQPITLYSTGLADGKGLRDLVTASAWRPNQVTVSVNDVPTFATPSSVWWTNIVMPLPTNPLADDVPILLTGAGTIYTQTGDATTSGYDLSGSASDGIAIVTLGSARLTYSDYPTGWCGDPDGTIDDATGNTAILCAGSVTHVWIEAHLATQVDAIGNGIYLGAGVTHSRVHRTQIDGGQLISNGLTIDPGNNESSNMSNLVDDSATADNINVGFNCVSASTYETIMTSRASANGQQGFWLGSESSFSHKVLYANLASNNGAAGVDIDPADQLFSVVGQTSFNNTGEGLRMAGNYGDWIAITAAQNGSDQFSYPSAGNPFLETFTNLALIAADHTQNGLYLQSNNSVTVTDLAVIDATIGIDALSASVTFAGDLLLGNNTTDVVNSGDNATIDTSGNHGPGLTIAPITGVDPSASFLGLVTVDDAVNASLQTAGTAAFAPADWLTFENPSRGWGLGGASPLFTAALAGACAAGTTCQIYDWRLHAADATLLNHFGAFPTDGGLCPTAVDAQLAANIIINFNTPAERFLRSAIEIMDPWYNPNGNFNGLCESNEACIYTPNLGAYQGTGDFTTRTCTFQSGNGVTNITMYAYPDNGI